MSSLDNHIKNQLKDFSPAVPPHIWENIRAERDRRKGFFWLWDYRYLGLAAVLFAGLLGAGAYYFQKKNGGNLAEGQFPESIELSKNRGAAENKSSSESVSSKPSNKKETGINIEVNQSEVHDLKNEVAGNNERLSSNSYQPAQKQRVIMASSDVPYKNTIVNKRKVAAGSLSDASMSLEEKEKSSGSRTKKSGRSKKTVISENQKKMLSAAAIEKKTDLSESLSENALRFLSPNLSFFEKRTQRAISWNLVPLKRTNGDIPCPSNPEGAPKKYFEFYAGPDMTFRSYRDTGHSAYLQKRKEATSTIFAYSAGARINKVYANGISLQAGLNYSHVIEKFKIEEGNVIQQVFILNANGDTIGNYMTIGTRFRSNYNQYHTVDLPVMLGYEFGKNKWRAAFHAGAIVNMYSWQKGYMLDSAYKAVSISTSDAPSPYQFKTNIGIGLSGSASLIFDMRENTKWFLEPYFRYNLSTINKEAITLRQKFHSAGLRVGLRYQF